MRRYLPTLILLLILLAIGGLGIARTLSDAPITRGAYVPTLSEDPTVAAQQGLILVVMLGAVIFSTIGMGIFLAITFVRLTRMMGAHPTSTTPAEGSARPSGPKAPAKSTELELPLNDDRSVAIFWIVLVVLVLGFLVLRYWGQPLGYLPGIGEMLNMPLFRLPGTHIDGLPPFIAGPGDNVTALHMLLAVLATAVGATLVTGLIMARGFARLDETVRSPDKLPRTLPDHLIPVMEQRVAMLRQPRPRRLPGNPIDAMLIGVNVLLLLVIGGIVALWVVPSYSGVAAVDQAIQATLVAKAVTATPQSAGGGEGALTQAEVMTNEFAELPAGNAAAGEAVFTGSGCAACHSLEADVVLVGPSLAGIGTRAATRKPDYSAEVYVYESIANPNAYVVEGFQGGIMPQNFKEVLEPQQLADVIAYLLTQQ